MGEQLSAKTTEGVGMTTYPKTEERLQTTQVQPEPLTNWDALRLRLKKQANRLVTIVAITDEFGELVGFAVQGSNVLEHYTAGR